MIKFTYDNGTVERLTLVLSQRDGTHLGQISNISNLKFTAKLNGADELSFDITKVADNHEEVLWDEIYDLRLVWIKELNEYFEIQVELTDKVYMVKTITATSLCEAELSQVYIHKLEVNTEDDIARDDYVKPTVFYSDDPSISLLHRALERAPAYEVVEVDSSLKGIQRTFSVDNQSIYDFLTGDCANEFDCVFIFDSANRKIHVHDLDNMCMNEECSYYVEHGYKLHYRGRFNDVCPKCGSKNIKQGYGKDTTVFVSTNNLTDEVKFTTDVNSMKNCFRLEAGDDDMTAAVVNINPNGSKYIYNYDDNTLRDMPGYDKSGDKQHTGLVKALIDYNNKYQEYRTTRKFSILFPSEYNSLVKKYAKKYSIYCNNVQKITNKTLEEFNGNPNYVELITHIYQCYDFYAFLSSSMMPSYDKDNPTIKTEMDLIKAMNKTASVSNKITSNTTKGTIESAIKNWIKANIHSGYFKISLSGSIETPNVNAQTVKWNGTITLTSYSNDEITDSYYTSFMVNTNYEEFMSQKVVKYLENNNKEDFSISWLSKTYTDLYTTDSKGVHHMNTNSTFLTGTTSTSGLADYSLARLLSYKDALEAVLGVLTESGAGSTDSEIYKSFYLPYYFKYKLAEYEYNNRAKEIEIIEKLNDGVLLMDSSNMLGALLKTKNDIVKALDMVTNIGENNYKLLTTYTREDTYSNSNYISTDLTNAELFDKAKEFMEVAEKELYKSSLYQHSISSNIENLLVIPEFAPIVDNFELGNWIRIAVDDEIYRLRLISYSIDYDGIGSLNTEFSDVTKTADGYNDVNSILKQASSMATSYKGTIQQSQQGVEAGTYIKDWINEGLSAALTTIQNNDNEEVIINETGITARTQDDEMNDGAGGLSNNQLRITHNMLAFTDDGWQSVKTALGKVEYYNTTHNAPESNYGLIAETVLSGYIAGTEIEACSVTAGLLMNQAQAQYEWNSNDGKFTKYADGSTKLDEQSGGNYIYLDSPISNQYTKNVAHPHFIKTDNFKVTQDGKISSTSGYFEKVDGNGNTLAYLDLGGSNKTNYIYCGTNFYVTTGGILNCSGADITGTVKANNGRIGNVNKYWNIGTSNDNNRAYIYSGTSSLTNDAQGMYLGTDGIRNYNKPDNYTQISSGCIKSFKDATHYIDTSGSSTNYIQFGNNFSVSKDGVVTISSTSIDSKADKSDLDAKVNKSDILNYDDNNKTYTTTISGGKISTGSIKSGTLTGTEDGTGYTTSGMIINLDNTGYIATPNFLIDSGGNAYFKGSVTATSGTIGGWNLNGDLGSNNYSKALWSGTPGNDNFFILSGVPFQVDYSISGSSDNQKWNFVSGKKFGITSDGTLYATGAHISGSIDVTGGGKVGSWNILANGSMSVGNEDDHSTSLTTNHLRLNEQWAYSWKRTFIKPGKILVDTASDGEGGGIWVCNGGSNADNPTGTYRKMTPTDDHLVSDRRYKENINTIPKEYIKIVKNLNPVSFYYKSDKGKCLHYGFIAQEVEAALKEIEHNDSLSIIQKNENDYYHMSYNNLHALSIKCIQDLYEEIDLLKEQIKELKGE